MNINILLNKNMFKPYLCYVKTLHSSVLEQPSIVNMCFKVLEQ